MPDTLSDLIALLSAQPPAALLTASLPVFLICAAASDAYRFIIPNWCSIGLLIGWLAAWAASPLGVEALVAHLQVFGIAFAVSFLLFALGVWGGGDAKLAPCALLWAGWPGVVDALLVMSYASIALALMILAVRAARRLAPRAETAPRDPDAPPSETEGIERATHAPYGLAIAAGALWAFGKAPVVTALAPTLAAALR